MTENETGANIFTFQPKNSKTALFFPIFLPFQSIYLCWSAGMIMGLTMGLLWSWGTPITTDSENTTTFASTVELNGLEMADYVIGMVLDSISMILSIVILRLLYLMLTMMKRETASR